MEISLGWKKVKSILGKGNRRYKNLEVLCGKCGFKVYGKRSDGIRDKE